MQTITLAMSVDDIIGKVQNAVWGWPLIILILAAGVWLTVRTGFVQVLHLGKALKFMVKNEDNGEGEVTSFGALCTALSATIGTGNIVGVATAICLGGPGALLWMLLAAFFGMATKYAEGVLAIKYRTIDENGHVLGGPFYYIENGMGKNWRWLGKIFAFFGAGVGLLGIGTFTQVNGITAAAGNFFDQNREHVINLFGNDYGIAVVVTGILLTICVALVVLGGGIMGEPYILSQLERMAAPMVKPSFRGCRVVPAALGNNAGLMGAGYLAANIGSGWHPPRSGRTV